MYYALAHFSKFIRPGAIRIGFENPDESLMVTAVQNPDGKIAVVVLNMNEDSKSIKLSLREASVNIKINAKAIQTIIIPAKK